VGGRWDGAPHSGDLTVARGPRCHSERSEESRRSRCEQFQDRSAPNLPQISTILRVGTAGVPPA